MIKAKVQLLLRAFSAGSLFLLVPGALPQAIASRAFGAFDQEILLTSQRGQATLPDPEMTSLEGCLFR